MLSIRMSRKGKKKFPLYSLIVTEKTRDPWGKYTEKLGIYNPHTKASELKSERITYWISKGAQPTKTVHNLLVTLGIIKADKVVAGTTKMGKKRAQEEKAKKNAEEEARAKVEAEAQAKIETEAQEAEAIPVESEKNEEDGATATKTSIEAPVEASVEASSVETPIEASAEMPPAEALNEITVEENKKEIIEESATEEIKTE